VISIRRRVIEPGLAGSLLVAALAASGAAQQVDSARTAARAPNAQARAREEPRPPISPKRAFLYSFLVPGYGQSVLDRPIAGAMFAGAEMTWIALAAKSAYDLRFARAHERDSIVVTYATNADGTVKLDSLGRPEGATYAAHEDVVALLWVE